MPSEEMQLVPLFHHCLVPKNVKWIVTQWIFCSFCTFPSVESILYLLCAVVGSHVFYGDAHCENWKLIDDIKIYGRLVLNTHIFVAFILCMQSSILMWFNQYFHCAVERKKTNKKKFTKSTSRSWKVYLGCFIYCT